MGMTLDPATLMNYLQSQGGNGPSPSGGQPQAPMAPQGTPPFNAAQPQAQQPAPDNQGPGNPYAHAQAQGIKGYLSNIFYQMGESAKAHLGMPTDVQVQQNQQKIDLQRQQIQAETAQKWAQIRQMSQLVQLRNGMMVPFALAKPYLDAEAKQYVADAGAQAKVQAAAIGKRFITVPNVGMFDTQAAGGPQLVPGSAQGAVTVDADIAKEYNIPQQLIGTKIPVSQFASYERAGAMWAPQVSTGQHTMETGSGQIVQVPQTTVTRRVLPNQPSPSLPGPAPDVIPPTPRVGPTTPGVPQPPAQTPQRPPVNLQTRNGVKVLTGPDGQPLQGKRATDMVYGYDPNTREVIATNRADANSRGLQITANNVGAKQAMDDRAMSDRLVDVQTKIGNYDQALQNAPPEDQNKMAYILNTDKFKFGAFGAELPIDTLNQYLKQYQINDMTDAGKKALVAYYNAREAMSGYNRVLTGSGRSSDKTMELNLDALGSPVMPKDYVHETVNQFGQNIKIMAGRFPRFPGAATALDLQKQQQGSNEPNRPTNVPSNYVFNANGPKGAGWYKP